MFMVKYLSKGKRFSYLKLLGKINGSQKEESLSLCENKENGKAVAALIAQERETGWRSDRQEEPGRGQILK